MAHFWPGVWKQDEDTAQRVRGQPSKQRAGIARVQPDIVQRFLADGGQRLGDALLERLAADEAGVRISFRLPDHVLGSAEADLEPDLAHVFTLRHKEVSERLRRRVG